MSIETLKFVYSELNNKKSNVVRELLPKDLTIYEWQHYPRGDVIDRINHTQYYYHSHHSHDPDRMVEHGHFHIFFRKAAIDKNAVPLVVSKKHLADSKKDNLCHLVSIAMNEFGFPTALFTLNHWVVQGFEYPVQETIRAMENFIISNSSHDLTSQWVTAMVQLFKPQITELLLHREKVIAHFQAEHPNENVWEAKSLEVTSLLELKS